MAPKNRRKRRRRSKSEVKSYVLLREMHLGYCKDTFPSGSKIEHYIDDDMLIINGRPFDDTRDLSILLRKGWVADFDEEVSELLISKHQARQPKKATMPIVEADQDAHPVINIRDTQVGKRAAEKREMDRGKTRAKTAGERRAEQMQIIRGDEPAAERRKRLLAELAELDGEAPPSQPQQEGQTMIRGMSVQRDGDYGYGYGGKQSSLNAGATVGRKSLTAQELEEMREEGRWKASEGIDTRNEVRAKMGLPPIPPKQLKGKDSSGATDAMYEEEDEEEEYELEDEGTFMDELDDEELDDEELDDEELDDESEFDVEMDAEEEFEEFDDINRVPVKSVSDIKKLIGAAR